MLRVKFQPLNGIAFFMHYRTLKQLVISSDHLLRADCVFVRLNSSFEKYFGGVVGIAGGGGSEGGG